jgi:hypothetical protein
MAAWHQSWRADIGLRLSGILLGGVAYLALVRLIALPVAPHHADALAYGLAAIGVVCTSAGSACVMLGRHLFDEIEVSSRWQATRAPPLPHDASGHGGG